MPGQERSVVEAMLDVIDFTGRGIAPELKALSQSFRWSPAAPVVPAKKGS
jgi:hypothetical protein